MRSQAEVTEALHLASQGLRATIIAAQLSIPLPTVRGWLRGDVPCTTAFDSYDLEDIPPIAYAYLLGLYLGDGYIAAAPRTFRLRISLDSQYEGIVSEAAAATRAVMPERVVAVEPHPTHRCVEVRCYSRHWPTLFPQHGPGRKHLRSITLAPWQLSITSHNPGSLIRGLIHSDGSRCVATQRTGGRVYRYARYYFSNRSDDIKRIFCDHLDLLGVRWTRPNDRMIQIARREAVAALDRFVGPKT